MSLKYISSFFRSLELPLINTKLHFTLLDSPFQGVNRLFALAYKNTGNAAEGQIFMNNPRSYSLPRVKLTKFNVLIDGRNFYDQLISSEITKYEELLKLKNKKHYSIIACDLSKQKELDSDPRAIQQLEMVFMLSVNSQILTILEK